MPTPHQLKNKKSPKKVDSPFSVHPQPAQVPLGASPFAVGGTAHPQAQASMAGPMFAPPFAQNASRNLQGIPQTPQQSPAAGRTMRIAGGGTQPGMGGARVQGGATGEGTDPTQGGARVKSVPQPPIPRAGVPQGYAAALATGQITPQQILEQQQAEQAAQQQAEQAAQQQAEAIYQVLLELANRGALQIDEAGAEHLAFHPEQLPLELQQWLAAYFAGQVQLPPVAAAPIPQAAPAAQVPAASVGRMGTPLGAPTAPFGAPMTPQAVPQARPATPTLPQVAPSVPQPAVPAGHVGVPAVHQAQPPSTSGTYPQRPRAGVGQVAGAEIRRGARVREEGPRTAQQRRGLQVRVVEPKITDGRPAPSPGADPAAAAAVPQAQRAETPDDVTVWLTVFRRPQLTRPQVAALENQTIPPAITWAIVNQGGVPLDEEVLGPLPQMRSNQNMGAWIRFFQAATVTRTPYVAILDDDVIPAPRWIEAALELCRQGNDRVVVAAFGATYTEDHPEARYVYGAGGNEMPQEPTRVDVGVGGWFMSTDLLREIMDRFPSAYNVVTGWDLHVAARAQVLEVPVVVLPVNTDTAGSTTPPVEDESSLSNAGGAEEWRAEVYRAYREAGFVPAVVDEDDGGSSETGPETAEGDTVDWGSMGDLSGGGASPQGSPA